MWDAGTLVYAGFRIGRVEFDNFCGEFIGHVDGYSHAYFCGATADAFVASFRQTVDVISNLQSYFPQPQQPRRRDRGFER